MWQLKVNAQLVECVGGFCYLGSTITDTGSCDKEVTTRIGKANSAFKRLAPETSKTSSQNWSHWCWIYYCTVPKNGQSQKQTGSVLKISIISVSRRILNNVYQEKDQSVIARMYTSKNKA